jgi:Superfamily II DNA/RNA helicases, SNF2 family
LTDYHAKYFAHELTKRCASDSVEKLAGAFVDAQVDLNPHQVEAVLFAFKSPLSKGALLADEVGLGKTIEAGLVLSQRWAERKRRLLAITPANLNQKNAADQRVFQLLSEKFSLFEGVFGASDEVLGAIESGVDFEKRIADIYQRCRTPEEINASLDQLQQELSQQIDEAMTHARQQLLENFDEEVLEKLRVNLESSRTYLDRYERMLMELTRYELGDSAEFLDGQSAFRLKSCPFPGDIPLGLYELPRRSGEAHLYRLAHPLAQHVLTQAKGRALPPAEIVFDYTHDCPTVSHSGASGWTERCAPVVVADHPIT